MKKISYLLGLKIIQNSLFLISLYGFGFLVYRHYFTISSLSLTDSQSLLHITYYLTFPFALFISFKLLSPKFLTWLISILFFGTVFLIESLVVILIYAGVVQGNITFYFLIRGLIILFLIVYFSLPKVRAFFRQTTEMKSSHTYFHLGNLLKKINKSFRQVSPYTLRGHFVLQLILIEFFIAYVLVKHEANDFLVLILSIGGLGTLGLLLSLNFIQFILSHHQLQRNPKLFSFKLAFHQGNIDNKIPYTFSTKGWFILPLFRISLTFYPTRKSFPLEDHNRLINVDLYSKQKKEIHNTIIFSKRAEYSFDHVRISCLDNLGLSRIEWEYPLEENIIIYPNVKKGKEYDILSSSTKEDYLDSTHRYLDGDYYEHRLYEIGDDMRRINWKLTAKRNELHVRISEKIQPMLHEVPIFFSVYNPYPQYFSTEEMDSLLEEMIVEVASYVDFLAKNQFKVFLGTDFSNKITCFTSQEQIMTHLAKIEWHMENHFAEQLNSYIHFLKEQFVDTTHLVLFITLLSEKWINILLETLERHQMSCTLILGKISPLLKNRETNFFVSPKLTKDRLSKLLFINSLVVSKGHLCSWKRFSRLLHNKKIPNSLSKQLIQIENNMIAHLQNSSSHDYTPLQIHYIENFNDTTYYQSTSQSN